MLYFTLKQCTKPHANNEISHICAFRQFHWHFLPNFTFLRFLFQFPPYSDHFQEPGGSTSIDGKKKKNPTKQHISSTFSTFSGIISNKISCYIYLGQHPELANLCSEVYLEASILWHLELMQVHWNCAVRHPEKYKRSVFNTHSPLRLWSQPEPSSPRLLFP